MAEFRLEKRIQATHVDVDVVRNLEQYLRAKDEELMPKGEMATSKVGISIEDSLGTETLDQMSEFRGSRFLDSVTDVTFSVNSASLNPMRSLRISARFNRSKDKSMFSVRYDGPNPRETVLGIYEGFSRIVAPHANGNGWVHPPVFVGAMSFVAGSLLLAFGVVSKTWYAWPALGTAAVLFGYLNLMPSLKPYISFDSRASARSSKVWDWIFWGAAAFLLFGTAATAVRKYYFGF